MRSEAENRAINKWEQGQVMVRFRISKDDAAILQKYVEENGTTISAWGKELMMEELACIKLFESDLDSEVNLDDFSYGKEIKEIVEVITVERNQPIHTYEGKTARDRTTYSKTKKLINIPDKKTVLKDCIPALLTKEELRKKLKEFGFTLSTKSLVDVLIAKQFFHGEHDLHIIDDYLEENKLCRFFKSESEK